MRTWDEMPQRGWTRRSVLVGLGAVTATAGGCGLLDSDPPTPPAPDPLEPLLAGTIALAARYDATIAALPALAGRLSPLRDAHRQHVAELSRMIGKPVPSGTPSAPAGSGTPSASPPTDKAAVAALRTAEQQAQQAAVEACLAAPPRRAPMLGSIAACRATHAEALA